MCLACLRDRLFLTLFAGIRQYVSHSYDPLSVVVPQCNLYHLCLSLQPCNKAPVHMADWQRLPRNGTRECSH